MFGNLLNQLGFLVSVISTKEWLEKIGHIDNTNALFPLKLLYSQTGVKVSDLDFPQQGIRNDKTQIALTQLGIQYSTDYFH